MAWLGGVVCGRQAATTGTTRERQWLAVIESLKAPTMVVGQKPSGESPMKPFGYAFLLSAALTLLADLIGADVVSVDSGAILLLAVLIAGVAWTGALWIGPRWVAIAALLNAVGQTIIWFIAASRDTRTFFGGAMMRIISTWGWGLVTVVLVVTALIRLAVLRVRQKKSAVTANRAD